MKHKRGLEEESHINFFSRLKEELFNPDMAPVSFGKVRERFKPNLDSNMKQKRSEDIGKRQIIRIKIGGLNLSDLATSQRLSVCLEPNKKHKNIFINYIN